MTMMIVTSTASAAPIHCSRPRWRRNARRSCHAARGRPAGKTWHAREDRTDAPPTASLRSSGGGGEAGDGAVPAHAGQQAGHFRTGFAAGQRQPQRVKQRLALEAGRGLERVGQRLPRLVRPVERRQRLSAALRPARARRGRARAARCRRAITSNQSAKSDSRSRLPRSSSQSCSVAPLGRRSATSAELQPVEQPSVEQLDVVQVEMRRGAAEVGEIEIRREFVEAGDRFDRLRRAEPGEQRQQGHRLERRIPRISSTPIEPSRFDNLPSAATSSASCANCGAFAPSASNICSWAALFETWSSPRTTWVTLRSTSSITLGSR